MYANQNLAKFVQSMKQLIIDFESENDEMAYASITKKAIQSIHDQKKEEFKQAFKTKVMSELISQSEHNCKILKDEFTKHIDSNLDLYGQFKNIQELNLQILME